MNLLNNWLRTNKLLTSLFMLLFTTGVIYLIFGHQTISLMYEGKSIPFLNNLLNGRNENSLEFYVQRLDRYYLVFNILFASVVVFTSVCFKLIRNLRPSLSTLNQDCAIIQNVFLGKRNKRAFFIAILTGISFYCLYLIIGINLVSNIEKFDFFGADVFKWLSWNNYNIYHKGSHPLILILLEPFKFVLGFLPFSKPILAVLLNSFFGASAISLSYLFWWQQSKKYVETLMLTICFGLTMSQLVFSSIPESYAMAACTIIPTYILFLFCLQSQRIYLFFWIFLGLLSIGITITNFAQTLVCFAITVLFIKDKNRIITIIEYVAIVICLCVVLNIIQKTFLGGVYFFFPDSLKSDMSYIKTTLFNNPVLILIELFKHFFLVNFVSASPFPLTNDNSSQHIIFLSFFNRSLSYNPVGLLGTILWVYIFVNGIYKQITLTANTNNKNSHIFLLGVSLAVLGNMALHSVFGAEEMFLYTCDFTFPVLLLLVNYQLLQKPIFKIALIILIFLMGINNLSIMSSLIKYS